MKFCYNVGENEDKSKQLCKFQKKKKKKGSKDKFQVYKKASSSPMGFG